MDNKDVSFVFYGLCTKDADPEQVKIKIAHLFSLSSKKANSLFSGKRVVIKKAISRAQAERYRSKFLSLGAIGEVEDVIVDGSIPATGKPKDNGFSSGSSKKIDSKPSKKKSKLTDYKLVKALMYTGFSCAVILGLSVSFLSFMSLNGALDTYITEIERIFLEDEYKEIHLTLSEFEQFALRNKEYPLSLSELNINDVQDTSFRWDEEQILTVEIKDGRKNMVLEYKPSLEVGRVFWDCIQKKNDGLTPPLECQTTEEFIEHSNHVSTSNKLAELYVPEYWSQLDNQDSMSLFYTSIDKKIATYVVSESKVESPHHTYGSFAKAVLEYMSRTNNVDEIIGLPTISVINGRSAIHYLAKQSNSSERTYLITVIDGKDYYHRVITNWVENKPHKYIPLAYKIASTFNELYQPSMAVYKSRVYYSNGFFEGDMVDGNPAGMGTYTWDNGDFAEGEFNSEGPSGDISYKWDRENQRSEQTFRGQLDSDYSGSGKFLWSSGEFEGAVKDGFAIGSGSIKWSEGDSYQGGFKNGYLDGSGVYYWPDGDSYTGPFKEGDFHGRGECRFSNRLINCVYKDGERIE